MTSLTDAGSLPSQATSRAPSWAPWIVRLVGLWILAGALFKLLLGTPADLPAQVRSLPLGLGLTYRLVISVELALVALALVRPRLAWPLLAATLLVFDAILVAQLLEGAESCGCFGSKISVSPGVMLAVDSALLAALLLARPWRPAGPARVPWIALPVLAGAGIAAPWIVDREAAPAALAVDGEERAPGLRSFALFEVEDWVGEEIGATPLADHTDVYSLPIDGIWVFYRQTCEHCAEHLEHMAANETGERMIALIQLRETHDNEANRVVHVKPTGPHVVEAALPDSVDYVITTPAEILLEGGVVVAAKSAVTPEEGL